MGREMGEGAREGAIGGQREKGYGKVVGEATVGGRG